MTPASMNFHHLRYFWAVAKDGNLTRTARGLRVSQSALSAQIRLLEDSLGEKLFLREGRTLRLSEAGLLAYHYAEKIFATGDELFHTLREGRSRHQLLRVGAVATLSRNFQESFILPLLNEPDVRLGLRSGRLDDLLNGLAGHTLDLVLSNRPVHREPGRAWRCRRIARQAVSIVGRPRPRAFRIERDLPDAPIIVPGPESEVRSEFEAMCEQRGIKITVLAEVDDAATMRLLVRDTSAIALLPSIVVRDEIRSGLLRELATVPGLYETFYAITVEREFPHPLLRSLLSRHETEILDMEDPPPRGASGPRTSSGPSPSARAPRRPRSARFPR
ncbi:MAG: LysR substrate-binding domain-containing protein [Deltaproteobacteria bacterium]